MTVDINLKYILNSYFINRGRGRYYAYMFGMVKYSTLENNFVELYIVRGCR